MTDRETLRRLIAGTGETRIDSFDAADRVLAAGWRQFAPISEAPTDGTTVVVWAAPAHGLPGKLAWCAYHSDAGWCVCELREVTHYLPGLTLDGLIQNSEGAARDLLSEGLNLCVRARNMDARERTAAQIEASADPDWWTPENIARRAERHNAVWPDQPMSTSATLPLWVQDQYDRDLGTALVWPAGDEDDEPLEVNFSGWEDAGDVAREACGKFWSERDGYEWMRDGCTLTIDMRGERHTVVVSVDFEPSFYGTIRDSQPIPQEAPDAE